MSAVEVTMEDAGTEGAAPKDSILSNSVLMFATTLMMAGGGAVFWVLAARLQSPQTVGIAGSLVATADSIALFAQLGLNIMIVRTMPTSTRKAADVLTAGVVVVGAGALFTLGYCVLLPLTSPKLADVLGSPLAIGVYCVLVAGTALNVLTDSVFLATNRLWDYLRLNGIGMSVLKCVLPFALAGAGAVGLYGAFGAAIFLCAAASVWVIFRQLPGRRSFSPSQAFLDSRRFAGAGYATYVLTVLPLLVFPLLIINTRGSADAAAYFIAFQLVTLLNAVILSVSNSTYAESERSFHHRRRIVRKGGVTLAVCSIGGAVVMSLLAPYFLFIFGQHYVSEGTTILRVLSFATVGAAFNYWSAMRLRLSRHLTAMVLVQLVSTAVMLVLAGFLVQYGAVWVAASWGIGHLVGGVIGYVASKTVARYYDAEPVVAETVSS
jgi:O-antigen/teichoic acid export membrane protein